MRIEIIGRGLEISDALSAHVATRLWVSVGRAADHLSWVGAELSRTVGEVASDARFVCRIDAWLRGAGPVSSAHTDVDPGVAVDRAAARLKFAVNQKARELAPRATGDRPCPEWFAERVWEDDGGGWAARRSRDDAADATPAARPAPVREITTPRERRSFEKKEMPVFVPQDDDYVTTVASGNRYQEPHDPPGLARRRAQARVRERAGSRSAIPSRV